MPGSTPAFGWPYPLDSDPIAQGADAIGQFALGVDTSLFLTQNSRTESSTADQYPQGTSVMLITTGQSASWPDATALMGEGATVVTFRTGTRAMQFIFGGTSGGTQLYQRSLGWALSTWRPVVAPGLLLASAWGFVSSSPIAAANTTYALPITYPAGRFSAAPRVQITSNAANPLNYAVSTGAHTATGFQANIASTLSNTSLSFTWVAFLIA